MNNIIIPTINLQKFEALCKDLLAVAVGVDMAVVSGRAGRGKTTAAERFTAMHSNAIYIRNQEWLTATGILREIAFEVGGARPRMAQSCLDIIEEGLGQRRRLILVDEADRLCLKRINTLRGLSDKYGVPVVLIGEIPIIAKANQERRVASRVRQILEFGPVSGDDVIVFYRDALGLGLAANLADKLARHAGGDFRLVVKSALKCERLMKTNSLRKISAALIDKVVE